MKKIIALLLVIIISFSFSSVVFASDFENEQTKINFDFENAETNYPYVFLHGIGGWGENTWQYKLWPYWGCGLRIGEQTDFLDIFRKNGLNIYSASVGPFSSAWDNACELFAQLTGTVVDYGEAHSRAHNHDRFGFSYEDKPLMGEPWNLKDKINLIGYSFGGTTIRLLTSLLKFGSEAEQEATGGETSALFKGGNESIHSCVTLSAPHNGTQVADMIYNFPALMPLIGTIIHLGGVFFGNDVLFFSFQLGHFGITPKENEKKAKFNPASVARFLSAEDNCAYDLTLKGAEELNEIIKISPYTYYYSYSGYSTELDVETGKQKPSDNQYFVFLPTCLMISLSEGNDFNGYKMEKEWLINDGVVPLASAKYPFKDKETALSFEKAERIEKGRWYYMKPISGSDHLGFCYDKNIGVDWKTFYADLINTVNKR